MSAINILDLRKNRDIVSGDFQPIYLKSSLSSIHIKDSSLIEYYVKLFDFYINIGGYASITRHLKPEGLFHLVGGEFLHEYVEDVSDKDELADTLEDLMKNESATAPTGITLGSQWVNHPELGNQINTLCHNFIYGIATCYKIEETCFDHFNSCIDLRTMKDTLVSDYTFLYLEGKNLNVTLSLSSVTYAQILEQVALRHLLCKFILSSDKMKNYMIGDINIVINNYVISESDEIEFSNLLSADIYLGKDTYYPEQYISGEKVLVYDDYIRRKESSV